MCVCVSCPSPPSQEGLRLIFAPGLSDHRDWEVTVTHRPCHGPPRSSLFTSLNLTPRSPATPSCWPTHPSLSRPLHTFTSGQCVGPLVEGGPPRPHCACLRNGLTASQAGEWWGPPGGLLCHPRFWASPCPLPPPPGPKLGRLRGAAWALRGPLCRLTSRTWKVTRPPWECGGGLSHLLRSYLGLPVPTIFWTQVRDLGCILPLPLPLPASSPSFPFELSVWLRRKLFIARMMQNL